MTAEELRHTIEGISLPPTGISLRSVLNHLEKSLIEKALVAANWNVKDAGDILGRDRSSLEWRMKKYGIKVPADKIWRGGRPPKTQQ